MRVLIGAALLLLSQDVNSFGPVKAPHVWWKTRHRGAEAAWRGRHGIVSMSLFDFIQKRAEEGLAQVQNIAQKTAEGKFAEALGDTAAYVKKRQEIDAENFRKLSDGLAKSRDKLVSDLEALLGAEDVGLTKVLNQLEEVLMTADIGAVTTTEIIDDLKAVAREQQLEPDDVKSVLRMRLIEALSVKNRQLQTSADSQEGAGKRFPRVLFVIGANGMGKTTTIGKIAGRLKAEANQTVLVAACDTFRAAAVDQLEEWTVRAGVDIHRPGEGQTKPVPVLEDAIARAVDGNYDVLIVDTSGRLSNNVALNEELRKLKSTLAAKIPGAPHETLLVLDGAVGRNGVDQAKVWNREVGITGLVITKLDGTARGGVVVSIVRELGLPVKLIGVGEGIKDLRDFEPAVFVDALLGYKPEQAAQLEERLSGMVKANIIRPSPSNPVRDDDISERMKKNFQRGGGGGGQGAKGGGSRGGTKRRKK